MIRFSQFITEVFNTRIPYRKSIPAGMEFDTFYTFKINSIGYRVKIISIDDHYYEVMFGNLEQNFHKINYTPTKLNDPSSTWKVLSAVGNIVVKHFTKHPNFDGFYFASESGLAQSIVYSRLADILARKLNLFVIKDSMNGETRWEYHLTKKRVE